MLLISACLLGIPCRYDGAARPLRSFSGEFAGQALLPVCPEELGGLPTPRPPAELTGGTGESVLDGHARVLRADGADVTAEFIHGAEAVLELARRYGIETALLKSKSPSCGAQRTHLEGGVAPGSGVCAALLQRAGLQLVELD